MEKRIVNKFTGKIGTTDDSIYGCEITDEGRYDDFKTKLSNSANRTFSLQEAYRNGYNDAITAINESERLERELLNDVSHRVLSDSEKSSKLAVLKAQLDASDKLISVLGETLTQLHIVVLTSMGESPVFKKQLADSAEVVEALYLEEFSNNSDIKRDIDCILGGDKNEK